MPESFFVPTFIVYFNGSRLPVEREADIREIMVIDNLDAPSSFNIRATDPDGIWCTDDDYYVGAEVEIHLGYKDEVEKVILGEVTGLSLSLKKNAANEVSIRGNNHTHRLCRSVRVHSYSGKTDKDIIEELAGEAGLSTDIENLSYEHIFSIHPPQTDFNYLLALAERHDCNIRIRDKKLYFKRLVRNSAEDLVLEYGKTLKELSINADTSRIISEVEVRGLDKTKHESIVGSTFFNDIDSKGSSIVDEKWGGAKKIHIDHLIRDQNSADQLALDILTRNARNYVSGSGSSEGNAGILAGTILKLKGLGKKFSGKYFVTAAKHILRPSGAYETYFKFTSTIASADSGDNTNDAVVAQEARDNSDDQNQNDESTTKKNPQIINLKWMKDGEEICKAHIKDEVLLTADVKEMDDGLWIRLRIYEKDYEGENDYIGVKPVCIKEGKVEIPWVVEYHKDEDDINSDDEITEKGYTLPEYIFIGEANQPEKIKSSESPVLEVYDIFSFTYRNDSFNGRKVKLILADGSDKEVTIENNRIRETDLPIGRVEMIYQPEGTSDGPGKQDQISDAGNPSIVNLKWMNDAGETGSARIDEEVCCTADVKNIPDGTRMYVTIYEKDHGENDNDFIEENIVKVINGQVKYKWQFEYHEDKDDVNSEEEEEETGYTKPEFIFNVEGIDTAAKSGESEVLEFNDVIDCILQDSSRKPLCNRKVVIYLADGETRETQTDEEGRLFEENVPISNYRIEVLDTEPEFSELKWLNTGQEVEKAGIGATLTLSARAENMKDGDKTRLLIYEKEHEDEEDYLHLEIVKVKNGEIKFDWKVENLSGIIEKEKTIEYVFVIDRIDARSEESGVLQVTDSVKFVLKGNNIKGFNGKKAKIILPGGAKQEVVITGNKINAEDLPVGVVRILLPD